MKQILIRLLFGLFVFVINLIIINPQITIFSNYNIDLRVLIPFLALLFLDPFINLFNPFFCSIKHQKLTSEPDELTITHDIEYNGKEPLNVSIQVHSTTYDIECKKGKDKKEMFIPEHTKIYLSKEKPNETLTFYLKRKDDLSENTIEKKATIKYRKGYLTQKIHIK
jgi:hypothetical protein